MLSGISNTAITTTAAVAQETSAKSTYLGISCRQKYPIFPDRVPSLFSVATPVPFGGPMLSADSPEIDKLLALWGEGDRDALPALIPLLYQELRRVARQQLRKVPAARTLQTTALVHEAYLRLHQQYRGQFQNKSHFIAICALLMRQILVGYEREKQAAKRGGGLNKCTLEDIHAVMKGQPVDLLDLDRALTELSRLDAEQGRLVELRFFGGLSIEETAQVLGKSPATVKRDWSTARIWLYQHLKGEAPA